MSSNHSITPQHLVRILESSEWRFAKTMPQNPHWYTLRKKWGMESVFEGCVQAIRDHGYDKKWGNRTYRYFRANGYDYWSMGAPLKDTILINRAMVTDRVEYDKMALDYDDVYSGEHSEMEAEAWVTSVMSGYETGFVLDIGCGTGVLLDYATIKPFFYNGIDPSAAMLEALARKHHEFVDRIRCSRFEDFYGGGYDRIVALFGVASYLDPESLKRIPQMLSPDGKAYLTFYADGYYPKSHEWMKQRMIDPPKIHPAPDGVLKGNYVLKTITRDD